jgi:hypothetical protein
VSTTDDDKTTEQAPDSAGKTGPEASETTDTTATETAETGSESTESEDGSPQEGPENAGEGNSEPDNSGAEGDSFPRAYVEDLRKEAAGYRTQVRELQERLHRMSVEQTGSLADPADLPFDAATLEEKGIPVTLRMWAAAGNVDVNSLINGQVEDRVLRKKLAELKSGGTIEPGDSSAVIEEEASIYRQLANIKSNPNNWINRDFNPEIVDRTVTGKRKFVHNQRGANAKANAAIAQALKNMSDPHYYEQLRRKVESRIKLYGEP